MTLRRRGEEARLALMLLTRLPTGRLVDPAPTLAEARWAFPLVGLPVGACAWIAQAGGIALGLDPLAAAIAALAAAALVTGALHLDGIADFADGIGGGRDRAHCLEIMRDSRIGSYGVLALIFTLALAAAALAPLAPAMSLPVLLFTAVGSRLAMLVALDRLPPARVDGMGLRAAGAAPWAWAPGMAATAVLGLWVGLGAAVALLAGAAVAGLLARLALRRIGGQTGDVLGAAQVLTETAGLLALSAWMTGQS